MTVSHGYILLARKVLESPIWAETPDLLKLFVYLLLQARHEAKPRRYASVVVARGELVTSLAEIAEDNQWCYRNAVRKWSRSTVQRMLCQLAQDGYIEVVPDTYGTHIRICNYETYQDPKAYKTDRCETGVKRVCNGCETDVGLNNNGKNVNKEEEEPSSSRQIFQHWNEYRGQTVTKPGDDGKPKRVGWRGHSAPTDDSVPSDIDDAIKAALRKHPADSLLAAIDNYAAVLLGGDTFWTYAWNLLEFLTRGQERHRAAPRQYFQFLPHNFERTTYVRPVKSEAPPVERGRDGLTPRDRALRQKRGD